VGAHRNECMIVDADTDHARFRERKGGKIAWSRGILGGKGTTELLLDVVKWKRATQQKTQAYR